MPFEFLANMLYIGLTGSNSTVYGSGQETWAYPCRVSSRICTRPTIYDEFNYRCNFSESIKRRYWCIFDSWEAFATWSDNWHWKRLQEIQRSSNPLDVVRKVLLLDSSLYSINGLIGMTDFHIFAFFWNSSDQLKNILLAVSIKLQPWVLSFVFWKRSYCLGSFCIAIKRCTLPGVWIRLGLASKAFDIWSINIQ